MNNNIKRTPLAEMEAMLNDSLLLDPDKPVIEAFVRTIDMHTLKEWVNDGNSHLADLALMRETWETAGLHGADRGVASRWHGVRGRRRDADET